MRNDVVRRGREELRHVRKRSRNLYWAVGIFSAFANLLMLTGPMYMLQVYDLVLGSGSMETLVALSLLVAFLYAVMGILDHTAGASWGAWAHGFRMIWTNACLTRSSANLPWLLISKPTAACPTSKRCSGPSLPLF
jgi:ABC-type protease/lipase transport system fused ATPase/permease subunit